MFATDCKYRCCPLPNDSLYLWSPCISRQLKYIKIIDIIIELLQKNKAKECQAN